MKPEPKNMVDRLDSIQSLRGIAALLVLLAHLQKELLQKYSGAVPDYLNIKISGQVGVDLFFVISGFIMVYISHNKNKNRQYVSQFLKKRFFRVVPLYWFYTTLTLVVSLLWASKKNSNDLNPAYVISSYLFVPWQRIGDDHFTPMLGVGWTLNYEIYFYLVFALAILLAHRHYLFAFCGFFCAVAAVGTIFSIDQDQLWYWTRPIVLEFVLGAVIAKAYLIQYKFPKPLGIAVLLIGLVWWQWASAHYADPTLPELRVLAWGMPSALVVAAVLLTPALSHSLGNTNSRTGLWLTKAGDSSYSLYLCHMFVLRTVTIAFPATLYLFPLAVMCYVCLSLLMAYYSYKWIEVPVNRFGGRYS